MVALSLGLPLALPVLPVPLALPEPSVLLALLALLVLHVLPVLPALLVAGLDFAMYAPIRNAMPTTNETMARTRWWP